MQRYSLYYENKLHKQKNIKKNTFYIRSLWEGEFRRKYVTWYKSIHLSTRKIPASHYSHRITTFRNSRNLNLYQLNSSNIKKPKSKHIIVNLLSINKNNTIWTENNKKKENKWPIFTNGFPREPYIYTNNDDNTQSSAPPPPHKLGPDNVYDRFTGQKKTNE